MDIEDEDIIELWKSLEKYNVQYIMIGGFATNFYGYIRNTDDIDLWLYDTEENRTRLGNALEEIDVSSKDIIQRMQFLPGWTMMNLRNGFKLDIMTKVKGLDQLSFDEYYTISIKANISGTIVPFLHINHLLEAKRAANREKDQLDIKALEQIKLDDGW